MSSERTSFSRRLACCLIGVLAIGLSGSVAAAPVDLRLLIDVSGSMKQSDPGNLRVPALQLVNELLPSDGTAGVWLFAGDTEALNPPGVVDDRWKARTRARLDRVHSRGQHTDIESAIRAAISGWDVEDDPVERHLILLTDGVVDVSAGERESAASRARIAAEQLPSLQALGARVHAVALSDHVDQELLRELTDGTGGWLEVARDADALQRVFLHMLEQAAAPTTVPIEGNRFDVDESVEELTLLAFRDSQAPTILGAPSGRSISAAQPGAGVVWRREPAYELVTIQAPEPGEWQLQGSHDPDNRVAVLTDMRMEIGDLPSSLPAGQPLAIRAWLTEKGQRLTRPDLLEILSAVAQLTPVGGDGGGFQRALALDPRAAVFQTRWDLGDIAPGVYRLQVTIDGGTFKRELQRRIRIQPEPQAEAASDPPLSIRYSQRPPSEGQPATAVATLRADTDRIDPTRLTGWVRLKGPGGLTETSEINGFLASPIDIELPITTPGAYVAEARFRAETRSGEVLDLALPPGELLFDFAPPRSAPPEPALARPSPETPDWRSIWLGPREAALSLAGGTLLILLLAYLGWRATHALQEADGDGAPGEGPG